MATVEYPRSHLVRARPARDEELAEFQLPRGSYMLVIVEEDAGIEVDSWPADRTQLRPAD